MTPKGVQLISEMHKTQLFSPSSQSESGPLLPQFSGDIKPGWKGTRKFEVVPHHPLVPRAKE